MSGLGKKPVKCPFCSPDTAEVLIANEHAVAFRDGFPISTGHTLVIPKRHSPTLFDLSDVEQQAVWAMVAVVRTRLAREFKPDGFNVGLNDGPAAGQTVPHAHVHVIPRYKGDVEEPRGGIRWIIPAKAPYWK